ncbi:MAG: HAD-IB family phosphatase, partial [Chloroflexota bacterium]|nr:HAD-IB family phosphatase [Chloroflexota bacterium]
MTPALAHAGPGGSELGAVPCVVICDFDGTVATADVQHVIFNHYAGDRWVPVNEAWRRGDVSTAERSRRQWEMVHASQQEIADLVTPIPLDPGFAGFVSLCRQRGWPLHIASDGFDFYISRMLAAHGLGDLSVFANHMNWANGHVAMTFARPNPACCRLGNCKRLIV